MAISLHTRMTIADYLDQYSTTADAVVIRGLMLDQVITSLNEVITEVNSLETGIDTPIIYSIENGIVAEATGLFAAATALTEEINVIGTSAGALDGVKLPASEAGMQIKVVNLGANSIAVFPNEATAIIDDLGAGLARTVVPEDCVTFTCYDETAGAELWQSDSEVDEVFQEVVTALITGNDASLGINGSVNVGAAGGIVAVAGGVGAANFDGGELTLIGGAGTTSADGGDVTITGGAAGTTSGLGGDVDIDAGRSYGATVGGQVTINGGMGGPNSIGGAVTITGGAGVDAAGGISTLIGGPGVGAFAGGDTFVYGGTGGTGGDGGDAILEGGSPTTDGDAGTARIHGGDSVNVAGNAGDILIQTGDSYSETGANTPLEGGLFTVAGAFCGQTETGTGGAGGAYTITGSAGGIAVGENGTGGAGSPITVRSGAGGAVTIGTTGAEQGGASGAVIVDTGDSGAINAGSAGTAGSAGNLTISTGDGGAATAGTAGRGGELYITAGAAGAGAVAGEAGFITITGGAGAAADGDGGDVMITGGTAAGTGTDGEVEIGSNLRSSETIADAAASPYYNVKTLYYTLGSVGVANCDYNFVTAANDTEQVCLLGEGVGGADAATILPAMSRVLDIIIHCTDGWNGATASTAFDIGSTSGGAEYLTATTTLDDTDDVVGLAVNGAFAVAPVLAASKIYISVDPDGTANWSALTSGRWEIWVTYVDNTMVG